MKIQIAIVSMLCAGVVSAQGVPVTANDYTTAELVAIEADAERLANERAELAAVQREIEALPQGAQVPDALERRRRLVAQKLQLRTYFADESDRRLVKDLSDELSTRPNHPWADDWRKMIADAQARLLREPLVDTNPLSRW